MPLSAFALHDQFPRFSTVQSVNLPDGSLDAAIQKITSCLVLSDKYRYLSPAASLPVHSSPCQTPCSPRDIVTRLHTDIAKVARLPDVQKQLEGQGATTIGNTPEQFAAYIKSESAKWEKVLKASGVKAD